MKEEKKPAVKEEKKDKKALANVAATPAPVSVVKEKKEVATKDKVTASVVKEKKEEKAVKENVGVKESKEERKEDVKVEEEKDKKKTRIRPNKKDKAKKVKGSHVFFESILSIFISFP